jgi:hypothetical protein
MLLLDMLVWHGEGNGWLFVLVLACLLAYVAAGSEPKGTASPNDSVSLMDFWWEQQVQA